MGVVIVGLGNQGRKRQRIAGNDVTATVDPVNEDAQYRRVEDVPLESYDRALVCTPDSDKIGILRYLLTNGKHVLVEKPAARRAVELIPLIAAAEDRGGHLSVLTMRSYGNLLGGSTAGTTVTATKRSIAHNATSGIASPPRAWSIETGQCSAARTPSSR